MLKNLLCLILVLISTTSCDQYSKNIDQIIKNSNLSQQTVISVTARRTSDNKDLYQHNSDYLMTPASSTKLLTAYAALKFLKEDFIYKTELLSTIKPSNQGILNANLYIKFSGDPTLTHRNLKDLIASLKLKNITGDIILDDSIFDHTYQSPGSTHDDFIFAFSAPSSAIMIDRNSFKAKLISSDIHPELTYDSPIFGIIDNKVITQDDDSTCPPHLTITQPNSYELIGCMARTAKDLDLAIAYTDPRKYAKDLIAHLLNELAIKYTGKIIFVETPPNSLVLATHNSEPLKELFKPLLKNSDNIIARSLNKTIGALYYNTQGGFANGTQAIKEIIFKNIGINPDSYRLADGSGTSRYNLISTHQFVDLLTAINKDPEIMQNIYNALPTPGSDGSLKNRFLDYPDSKIRAKTGYHSGAISLSGYAESKTNGLVAFSIILNGSIGEAAKYHQLIDQIAAAIEQD